MSLFNVLSDSIIAEVSEGTDELEPENGHYINYYKKCHIQYAHYSHFFGCSFEPRKIFKYGYERKVKRVKTLTNAEVEGIMAVEKRNIFNKRKRTMLEKIICKMSFHHRG